MKPAGLRAGRRQQQVHRHLQAAAWLQRHQAAKAIVHPVDVVHLVQHGRAGDAEHTAGDHFADLALAVHLGQL